MLAPPSRSALCCQAHGFTASLLALTSTSTCCPRARRHRPSPFPGGGRRSRQQTAYSDHWERLVLARMGCVLLWRAAGGVWGDAPSPYERGGSSADLRRRQAHHHGRRLSGCGGLRSPPSPTSPLCPIGHRAPPKPAVPHEAIKSITAVRDSIAVALDAAEATDDPELVHKAVGGLVGSLRTAEGVWRHALPSLALCGIHGLGARQAPGASLVHPLRAVSSWIAFLGGRWIVCPCWARPACPGLGCIAEGGRYQHFLTVPHGWDGGVRLPEAGLVPRYAGRHALLAKRRGVLPFLSMRPGPCRSPCLRLTEKGKP